MNWDRVEGHWKQRRGKAVYHWGKIMNDELAAVAGKREQLVGVLQEKYGITKTETKRQVDDYKKIIDQLKKSNRKLIKSQKSLSKKVGLKRNPVNAKRTSNKRHAQT